LKIIEILKLKYRTNKYKNKSDVGGIAYLNETIQAGQTALDIGAHKAGYLYFMLNKVGKNGKVFAFEPQSNLYNYLIKIKSLLNWNNATIEHLALSNSAGEVKLFIPSNKVSEGSSPGATIVEQKENTKFGITEIVKTETLENYCAKNNIKPNFLKIDVEGNELQVLKGGETILKTQKPKILVEIEARHIGQEKVLETFKYLQSLGYNGFIVEGLQKVPIENFSFEKHQNLSSNNRYCNNFIFE
jgi:FkbM family methyltransferase